VRVRDSGKTEVIIGLGSNVGDRESNILKGVELLDREEATRLLALSPAYETTPVGPSKDPFLNAAALLVTGMSAETLLGKLKKIEKACGRQPADAWGMPRTLDMDILLFGNEVIAKEELTVPHPGFTERDFALRPLLDLRPDALHPSTARPLREVLREAPLRTITAGPFPLPSNLSYALLEHTADMGIEVSAPGRKGLFEACAMALADHIVPRTRMRERIRHDSRIEGDDDGQILVGLLQEVLFLFDSKNFLPVRVSVHFPPEGAAVSFFGQEVESREVQTSVKAATYHMLDVGPAAGETLLWRARVYFDV
jgi:2-amino-4-hydroxy-6-hydroxymethyldihydropteridine diphosphokinase